MAYDAARGRVVLFGGSSGVAEPPTTGDLRADTWELPIAAGPGPDPEPPQLVSFTISPDSVPAGEPVTFAVGLDRPASSALEVAITSNGDPAGAIPVDAGQAAAEVTADSGSIGAGEYEFGATLGATTLTAKLLVTETT